MDKIEITEIDVDIEDGNRLSIILETIINKINEIIEKIEE
tara:strand:- start:441 stop:560 length:120 start_codon:yes stop_codon:yes gene_type:complete